MAVIKPVYNANAIRAGSTMKPAVRLMNTEKQFIVMTAASKFTAKKLAVCVQN